MILKWSGLSIIRFGQKRGKKMVRIGILGTDGGDKGGHALNICKILKKRDDVKICGLFGDVFEETNALAKMFDIEFIAEKPEDLIGSIDAVFVLPRHGDKHKAYAMPFVKAGLPVFIDKPFTCTVSDARELIEEIKISGSILCAGSYIKLTDGVLKMKENLPERELIQSGCVCYPTTLESPYGGLHFYSHHLIESMLQIFGTDVKSVSAVTTSGSPIAVANYDGFPVVMNYASNEGALKAEVYFTHDKYLCESINYAGMDDIQCDGFIEAIKSGKGEDPEFYLAAVKVCNAFIKSLEEKREVFINEI